ncbi:MAG: alpha-L-rhamnosidase C-terminal domain-containing protein [Dysgonomonas sp.]
MKNFNKTYGLIVFCILCANSVIAKNRPTGLLTDLLKHTDIVYINGYPSSISLSGINDVIEPIEYTTILSTHPAFSWIVPGEKNGTMQTAYHIIVADSQEDAKLMKGTVWDSGLTESNKSVSILYEGEALQPSKTYYWRIKTYTNTDGESDWSEIKVFRTGQELKEYASSSELLVKSRDIPRSIDKINKSIYAFDFGKAAFGQLLVTLTSETGCDTVQVNMGELSKDKRVDSSPGGSIRYQSHTLPLKKGTHTYQIKIKKDKRNTGDAAIKMPAYIGEVMPFRYAEIVGYEKKIKDSDIIRETVTYPFDDNAAYFHCDNDILNQIWELCHYSIKATSFAGIYIDGDRERIPYEADAIINQLGHYSVDREYSMARRSHEHLLKYPTWPTEWILQSVLIAWYDYLYTGDLRSLAANYEVLQNRSLMQLKEKNGLISTTTGLQTPEFSKSIHFNGKIRDIVDWPNTNWGKESDYQGEADGFVFTDYNAVVNAYYYEALKLMEQIAYVLGKNNDVDFYKKEHTKLRDTYNNTFFDKKRGIYIDGDTTNHAALHTNMFALDFGLVPEKHISSVLEHIRSRKMACSVYGSQFLMESLYDGSDADYALSLLTSTDIRSWYNMIRVGSTISLESWDNKYKPNQDWNHAWGAAPANIIPRRLLGVEPVSAGFECVRIRPQISHLKSVESKIPTIRGDVELSIKQNNDTYTMTIKLPANMSGEIYLPVLQGRTKISCNGEVLKATRGKGEPFLYAGKVPSGTYTFIVQ